ncbi:MAG: phospholipid methyltransferase [Chitinophagia bacterium]|jgi:phospholipid N-methyltransferase|nr:phospholipid methyltransferase [Chitinophagia bacterium]
MAERHLFKIKDMSKAFIKEFWKDKKMIGSMVPSSKYLAAKMLDHIPFKNTKLIIELGPGTGIFTEKIIQKLDVTTQLIVLELNSEFYQELKAKICHTNVHIKEASADKIGEIMLELGFEKADVIISSLPLANFSAKLRNSILEVVKESLNENGSFIQFQYSLNAYKNLKQLFPVVKLNFTALNFPPAFVYTCSKR